MASSRRRRPPSPLEKVEQAHSVELFDRIGAQVYVLGTRRKKTDHQGTMQTPGLPDLLVFLPPRAGQTPRRRLLMVEQKRSREGRFSPAQIVFRELCQESEVAHVGGDFNAVIAWLVAEGYCRDEQFPHYRQ